MSSDIGPKAKLLRSWLAIVRRHHDAMHDYLEGRIAKGRCWVCGRRRCYDATGVSTFDAHWSSIAPSPGSAEYATLNRMKGRVNMGWKDSREDVASKGAFIGLQADGEKVSFVPLTEPEPTEKDGFKGSGKRTVYRVLVLTCPVGPKSGVKNNDLTMSGFPAYAAQVGEGHECKSIVEMTRHGDKGDIGTTYTFKVLSRLSTAHVKLAKAALKEATRF